MSQGNPLSGLGPVDLKKMADCWLTHEAGIDPTTVLYDVNVLDSRVFGGSITVSFKAKHVQTQKG